MSIILINLLIEWDIRYIDPWPKLSDSNRVTGVLESCYSTFGSKSTSRRSSFLNESDVTINCLRSTINIIADLLDGKSLSEYVWQ